MNNKNLEYRNSSALFYEASFVLIFLPLALNLVFANVGFVFGISLSKWTIIASYLSTIAIVVYLFKNREIIQRALFFVSAFAIPFAIYSIYFYDVSWDGLAIHQNAIHRLVNGWNPIREDSVGYWPGIYCDIWVQHYPKANWINSSLFSILFGGMEIGKIVNLLGVLAVFTFSMSFFLRFSKIGEFATFLLSLLLALNPVCIPQITSFYLDGTMACALTILVLSLVRYCISKDMLALIGGAVSCMVATNLKFTGLAYCVILIFFALLYVLIKNGIHIFITSSIKYATILLLSIAFIGFSPYIKNILQKGHVFYPLNDETSVGGAEKILENIRPINIVEKDRVTRLLISIFSESGSIRKPYSTTIKNPFSISENELKCWWASGGLEAGGFGPLFAAFLLLAVAGFGLSLTLRVVQPSIWQLFLFIGVIASLLINKEAWWARYAPQTYLIPLICIFLMLNSENKLSHGFAIALMLLGIINISIIGKSSFDTSVYYKKITENAFCELRCLSKTKTPYVNIQPFPMLQTRLKENGIDFLYGQGNQIDFTMPPGLPPK
jgi:hypothetical protein